MRKTVLTAIAALLLSTGYTLTASIHRVNPSPGISATISADDETEQERKAREKAEKELRKKEEKERKAREKAEKELAKKNKEPKTADEIIALLQAIEWKKPAPSGLDVDRYYDKADEFFTLLRTVSDSVTIYRPVKVTTPSGRVEVLPVDNTGKFRKKGEAFDQALETAGYMVSLTTQSAVLAAETLAHSVQIAQDAIPFVGNKDRKAANVQIAKATKAFPLLKQLMNSQRNMAQRYFRPKNVEITDSVDEVITTEEIDFMETQDMTDEELNAYIEAEMAES